MRKHVKPADPAASIPDPARKTDLPPEGRVVDWSVHWARLAAREDIVVTDAPEDGAVEELPAASETQSETAGDAEKGSQALATRDLSGATRADLKAAEPPPAGTVASVPFMITAANRKRLKALGKTDDEIANMKPEEAQAILAANPAPDA